MIALAGVTLAGIMLTTALPAAAQPGQAGTGTPQVLRVITGYASPFVKLPGTPVSGYSIDVWQEVARRLGLGTSWTVLPDLSD